MPANVDGMVREGISAYRAGRKDEARALLLRAVEIDQYNEQSWLWLSAVVESVDEQRTCLENVLTINPNNDRAKQGLQMLNQKSSPAVSANTASSQADDVLAGTSFTAPPAASPFGSDDDDELPSSIEWEPTPAPPPTATSSASSNYQVAEPSPAEYDDWVSNLGLGSGAAEDMLKANPLDAAAEFMSTPAFDDDDDDDIFDLRAQTLGADDDEDDLFSSGPFSASEPAFPVSSTPPPVRAAAPAMSPKSSPAPKKSSDALLDDIDEDEDLFGSAFDTEFGQDELGKLDASEFFQYIPKGIRPTRLPGTRERYPALVILGFLVVILLNIGAVALLVMNLTA
jgi:hypothetical protein